MTEKSAVNAVALMSGAVGAAVGVGVADVPEQPAAIAATAIIEVMTFRVSKTRLLSLTCVNHSSSRRLMIRQ